MGRPDQQHNKTTFYIQFVPHKIWRVLMRSCNSPLNVKKFYFCSNALHYSNVTNLCLMASTGSQKKQMYLSKDAEEKSLAWRVNMIETVRLSDF